VLKKRATVQRGVQEVVAEGIVFPGVPMHSDIQDGLNTHFPNPKVVSYLRRSTLEEKYRATFTYSVRLSLHPVIMDILNKNDLAPVQIVPMLWHNICSFIATYELRRLTYTSRAFAQAHSIQRAPKETGDLGCYCFNNKKGFMTAIEKKSKVKN